jgi:stage II sporulation protein R
LLIEVLVLRRINQKWLYSIVIGALVLSLSCYTGSQASVTEATVKDTGLIRLHVIANSDSQEDQALKRKVRDEIIQAVAPEFTGPCDIASARLIAQANINRMQQIAQEVIKEEGKDYAVTVELGDYPFPTKHYGAFILPAGDYEAVRVVIGNGSGTNWWCVLFPPLCFVDMTRHTQLDPSFKAVSNSLPATDVSGVQTREEPDSVINNGTKNSPLSGAAREPEEVTLEQSFEETAQGQVIFSFRLLELIKRL